MEQDSQLVSIAQTIIKQIQYGDKWFLPAVGATNFVCLCENNERMGGLEFKVKGLLHCGWCKVELKFNDTYRIIFIDKKREVVKIIEECYCDQLIEFLDFVEGR